MLKRILILIICAVFVFQCGGLILANGKAEEEKKGDTRQEDPETLKEQVKVEGEKEVEGKAGDEKEIVKKEEVSKEEESKEEVTKEVVAKEDVSKEEEVVAIVNGVKLFSKDLERRLSVYKKLNQEITHATKLLVVGQLTKKLLLKQFINKQNIKVGDDEIKSEVGKIKALLEANPGTSGKKLEEILESKGSSIEVLKGEVRETLALSKHLKKDINDDEMEEFFDKNENFFNGEKVRVTHILIDTRNLKTEEELEGAKRKIEEIKKEIDNGADISELAKKYSDCPSAEKGGDIGYFGRRGSVVESFAKAAFSMKVGEVGDPVKTPFGYHILKVTDKKEGKEVRYDDVKDMVEFVYMEMKTEDLVKSLTEKSKIEVFL